MTGDNDGGARAAAAPKTKSRGARAWLSPGGLSAVAGLLAVVVAAVGLFVQQREPSAAPSAPGAAGSPSVPVPVEPALFVYGSSMPGMARYDVLSRHVVRSARDSVQGSLYDSGLGYPLARFGGTGELRGFVLWLDPATAEAALTEMTRVEAGLFHPVTVRTAGGVTAQAYEWIGSTDGFPRIEVWDGSTAGYGAQVAWQQLAEGDCFQAETDVTMLTAWCEAPHALEAYASGTVGSGVGDPRAFAERTCDKAFEAFVGRPRGESELLVRVYAESASASSRPRYLCAVGVDGAVHAGTLRGADR